MPRILKSTLSGQPQYVSAPGGSVFAYLPSIGPYNLVDNTPLTLYGDLPVSTSAAGFHVARTTAGNGKLYQSARIADNTISEATLIAIQSINPSAGNVGWHHIQTDVVNTHVLYGGAFYLSTFSNSRWLSAAAAPAGYDRPHTFVIRAKGTERKAWLNKTLVGSGTADANVRWSTWQVGSIDTNNYLAAKTYALVLFPYALSEKRIIEIADNPWQLFSPAARPLYFDVGAGGGAYTSPADPGTINLSGFDSVDVRALLSATNTGSISITGSDATSTRSRISAAEVGQITLTGVNATSLRQLVSQPNTGSIALTGYDATSTEAAAGATVSSADPGSFDILGYTANSIRSLLSSGEVGAYSITGFDATASKSILSVTEAGSLSLTGFDTSAFRTFVSTTDTGQIVLTGYDATSSSVVPDVGRPSSDVSGTWIASTGADKYAMVDDVTMDNSDYIYTNTVGAIQRMTLNAMADPGAQGQVFSYSVWSPTGHGITVRLLNRSDDSVIAEWVHPGPLSTTAPATEVDATHQSLTPTQIAAIIDYAAIDLEVEATA